MLVERKPVSINGIDFSESFTDVGYDVNYIKRTGKNGGTMQDGSITEDVITIKAVVTLPRMPLNEDKLSALLDAVLSTPYPLLEYFDPWRKTTRMVMTVVSPPKSKYRGIGSDDNSYWSGDGIVFTEK